MCTGTEENPRGTVWISLICVFVAAVVVTLPLLRRFCKNKGELTDHGTVQKMLINTVFHEIKKKERNFVGKSVVVLVLAPPPFHSVHLFLVLVSGVSHWLLVYM